MSTTEPRHRSPEEMRRRKIANKANTLKRHHRGSPEEIEASRLAGAELITAAAARVVADFPPLRPDQVDRVVALLRGATTGDDR